MRNEVRGNMNNRWDDARTCRGLDKMPIQNDHEYIGRLDVDFDKIYADLKDHDWIRADWYVWNWRVKELREQSPFPENESTKYVDKKQILYSELPDDIYKQPYEPFEKIAKDLDLYMPEEYKDTNYSLVKINRQMPGDMLWMHYDYMADNDWDKYLVFLNDWAPGQVSLWGEHAITGWKSGDCYKVNVTSTPHGAVNCGPEERWVASVRGKRLPVNKTNKQTNKQIGK